MKKNTIKKLLAFSVALVFVCSSLLPAISVLAGTLPQSSHYTVTFNGVTLDSQNDRSTWSYTLTKTGEGPDLSHWVWDSCISEGEVSTSPEADEIGYDGSTLHTGVKWETEGEWDTGRTYEVTVEGQYAVDQSGAIAVIKAGQAGDQNHGNQPHFDLTIPGPDCSVVTECTPEETRSCDSEIPGICASGTQTCDLDGYWGDCVQDTQATDEICDNDLDDNCNGEVDEDCDPVCGNEVLEEGEECDDGNSTDGDGCSSDCTIEETECIPEGGSGAVIPDALECCEGLVTIGCDQPDQHGECLGGIVQKTA